MNPKICASIAAKNINKVARVIEDVELLKPDLIEVRLDYLESPENLEKVRKATDLPLIATNRRRDQGGLYIGPEPQRIGFLLDACGIGFDYVDLELTTASIRQVADDVREHGTKLIVSRHDLHETPTRKTLENILDDELNLDPDICKIVGTAKSYQDNLVYLGFLAENPGIGLVCFGMGGKGVVSRALSPLFGGVFTYASAEKDTKSAPGQLTITELRQIYRLMVCDG